MVGRGRLQYSVILLVMLANVVAGQNKKFVCSFAIKVARNIDYRPDYIPLEICTHVRVESFAFPRFVGRQMIFDDNDKIAFSSVLSSIRRRSKTIPVIAAIAGSSQDYSDVSSTNARRKPFGQAVASLLLELDADAIELRWRSPGNSASSDGHSIDRITMVTLLQDLRQVVNAASQHIKGRVRELWMYGSLNMNVIKNAYNFLDVCDLVDHVTLDPDSAESSKNVHAPIFVNSKESFGKSVYNDKTVKHGAVGLDAATQQWIDDGCPPRKLLLGISMYGVKTLYDKAFPFHDVGFPIGDREFVQHRVVCTTLREPGWSIRWDPYGLMYYATRSLQNQREERLSYEDQNSLRYKMDMVERKRLGGIYIDYIHTDDIYGQCGQPYALTAYLSYRVRSIPSDIGFAIEWS